VLNAAGAKVDPIVLEAQALGYDGITDAAAFMAGSEDGVERIALAFVSDEEPDADDLAHYLRYRLGGSAPLVYVRLGSIPRNEMGKVLRSQLTETYAALVR
jgi:acyl-CoA synthetase (AMP-forming)/AMP-acid ligase II